MKMNLSKILVPTDFSACSEAALDQGLALARQHGAELHLLHVMMAFEEDPYSLVYQLPDRYSVYEKQEKACEVKMGDMLAVRELDGVNVQQHRPRSVSVAPAVVELAEAEGIDLIVQGAHGRRGWRRFLLGSVAEEVVRRSTCPVLTVQEKHSRVDVGERRVLVPVDFSEPSRQALRAAKNLAGDGADLEVVHVIEHPVYPQYYDVEAGQILFPQMTSRVKETVEEFVKETLGDEDCTQAVVEGRPAQQIVERAEADDVDLIVIATQGHSGIEHLLLGSVTEKVVRLASCPVLTLRYSPPED